MIAYGLVALGGAVGALGRFWLGERVVRLLGPGFPYGTLVVNVAGGLLMGVLAGWLALRGGAEGERWRLLLGAGVLGGFTTFSAFSLELALMIERRAWPAAALYAVGSVLLSVAALFVGLWLARRLPPV